MRPVTTHFPLSPPRGICQLILSRDNNHFLRDGSSNLKENCQEIIKKEKNSRHNAANPASGKDIGLATK